MRSWVDRQLRSLPHAEAFIDWSQEPGVETEVRLRFEEMLQEARTALDSVVAETKAGHIFSDHVHRRGGGLVALEILSTHALHRQ